MVVSTTLRADSACDVRNCLLELYVQAYIGRQFRSYRTAVSTVFAAVSGNQLLASIRGTEHNAVCRKAF